MYGARKNMNNKKIIFSPTNELTSIQEMPSPASSNTPDWFKKAAPHILDGEGYYDIVKINKKNAFGKLWLEFYI